MSVGCAWRVEPVTSRALALAEAALGPQEREQLAGFRFEKRRCEWLMGRWLLKQVAAEALGPDWQPDRVVIAKGVAGSPEWLGSAGAGEPLHLSLTHSHGWVGAVAAPWPLGLDIERVRAMPAGSWRYYLSEAERDWLAEHPLGPHSDLIVWSLKEAAFKAWGGRSRALRPLELRLTVGQPAVMAYAGEQVFARWAVRNAWCVAVAAAPPGLGWLNELDLRAFLPVADNTEFTGILRLEAQ